jgi:hypothetical protein
MGIRSPQSPGEQQAKDKGRIRSSIGGPHDDGCSPHVRSLTLTYVYSPLSTTSRRLFHRQHPDLNISPSPVATICVVRRYTNTRVVHSAGGGVDGRTHLRPTCPPSNPGLKRWVSSPRKSLVLRAGCHRVVRTGLRPTPGHDAGGPTRQEVSRG